MKNKNIFIRRLKSTLNFKIIVSFLLVGICFICGATMLFFGIKETYGLNKKTKNYREVEGYFSNYSIYSMDEDGITYRLIYSYTVDEKEYTVSTGYGTDFIPRNNSTRMIKYNLNNPEEAIIDGAGNEHFLIFMGIIFTFVPIIILLGLLTVLGYLDNFKIDFIGIIIGITFIAVGFGTLYIITGKFSLMEMFKSYSFSYIIPFLIIVMFIVVGFHQLIKSLFFKSEKNIKRNHKKIKR